MSTRGSQPEDRIDRDATPTEGAPSTRRNLDRASARRSRKLESRFPTVDCQPGRLASQWTICMRGQSATTTGDAGVGLNLLGLLCLDENKFPQPLPLLLLGPINYCVHSDATLAREPTKASSTLIGCCLWPTLPEAERSGGRTFSRSLSLSSHRDERARAASAAPEATQYRLHAAERRC
jgi:hypothetical protein